MRRHRQCDHDIDLVRRLFLRNAPTAWGLNRNGARDRESHIGVGVDEQPAALDQLIEVAANLGEIAAGLRKFAHRHTSFLQPLRHRRHLIRVVEHTTDREAGHQIAHGALDRRLEIKWFFHAGLENAVYDEHNALHCLIERHHHDRGRIALHRGVDANPHRQRGGNQRRCHAMVNAGVPPSHVDEARLRRHEPVLDHPQILVRAQAAAHLGKPRFRLPRRDRQVRPEHQQPVAGMEIGANLRLLEAALVKLFEQRALALEAGVSGDQPRADPAHRRRNHLVPQPARAFGGVTPKLVE